MAIQVVMPQLGESVDEGTITKWLKSLGDSIAEFDPLVEVNTDKVDTEIPSPASGVLLEILAPEGETVKAGAPLAWISASDEKAPSGAAKKETETVLASEATTPSEEGPLPEQQHPVLSSSTASSSAKRDLGFISPVVSRLASENNIDLYQLQGTGLGGRITKKDILTHLDQRKTITPAAKPTPQSLETAPKPKPTTPPDTVTFRDQPTQDELIPLNNVRKKIAEHMVMSKHTSPHVTTVMEADLSRVVRHRNQNKDAFSHDGVNLTFTAYFVSAAVNALKAYPMVNSSWQEEGILVHRNIHIGMATSLGEAGLIVPVIKNADQLSLLGIARAINDLAQRARSKQLKPDEVHGGTFSITNHGISGSLFASPIINQPQCAILGIGAIQKRAVVVSDKINGDSIAIRPMLYLSLTFDHRILDGAIADYFLGKVVESLTHWQ